jgi:retinol dehydrogenase 14
LSKIAVVTGASSGIGYCIAEGLAFQGFKVFMVCRDQQGGKAAAAQITSKTGNKEVVLFIADLASQKQVRKLGELINKATAEIDVLINNAGGVSSELVLTEDNVEWQFAVNHLAPFLLTSLLLNRLKASPQARIINMSSRAHSRGAMHFEDLFFKKEYSITQVYNQSKLANLLFTYQLADKLQGTPITVNCMHPGLVNTSFGNKQVSRFHSVAWSVVKWMGISPAKAAETAIFLATDPDLNNITGKYFANKKKTVSSKASHNREHALKLWEISIQLTGAEYL